MQNWLHLLYKLPRNPSKVRVYVWRKLKRLGAVLLHESVWCLPSTLKTREQFQWLVVEIQELGGEASLWETRLVIGGQDEMIIQQFIQQVDKEYKEILEELKKEESDLVLLSKKYQQIKIQDYFQSELGKQVLEELQAARGGIKE
ncbi:Chromate resistance protein ChrB [Ammoniphilus sp. 3BR4]|uniref:Chromate resistance protein ChrB n=1 Tax=Ammoniphilus sp. 3BR4 TaxID=3158265 RepID=UPI00346748BD